ncbi:hypothetical protein JRQ81_019393, partial [Phrynocephalus forsythii]
RANLALTAKAITFRLHRSKTDQKGKGELTVLQHCADPILCLVHALKGFLACRGDTAGPLFRHQDGSSLTKFQFLKVTNATLPGWEHLFALLAPIPSEL